MAEPVAERVHEESAATPRIIEEGVLSREFIESMIEIADRRAALLERMKQALLAQHTVQVLELARQLCGIQEGLVQ
jgi:hypothetical protein